MKGSKVLDLSERNRLMAADARAGASITEVAQKYGLSPNWAGAILDQQGVPRRSQRGVRQQIDGDGMVKAYLEGRTIREIADWHETSYGTVYRLLRARGVRMRPRGSERR